MLAARERRVDVARTEPRQVFKQGSEFGQNPPICPCVSHEENEALGRIVASLEIDAAS